MGKKDFADASYASHENHYKNYLEGEESQRRAGSWKRTDTVDAWCRLRIISSVDPILQAFPDARWVTVGDGRYGSDAHYLESQGIDVLATDISDVLLTAGLRDGFIHKAQRENAEALSLETDQFDFALCKDSLHHFPRPYTAIYEMLRVAKQGIFLIEPNDELYLTRIPEIVYKALKESIFRIFGRRSQPHQYEVVGNYIYGFSRREIEKIALGLNFPTVAFRALNNYYIDGVEDELLASKGPLYRKVRFMIAWRNLLSFLRLKPSSILVAFIAKHELSPELEQSLFVAGYEIRRLPRNPYLTF